MLITWEDKIHDKMTSAYSKSCGYKKFSVHTNTKKYRFQIVPLWRAFSKSSVFVDLFMRISVDGSRIRCNKVAFSNLSGIVWTGPQMIWTRQLFDRCLPRRAGCAAPGLKLELVLAVNGV